jgi:HlyD family secretion protein
MIRDTAAQDTPIGQDTPVWRNRRWLLPAVLALALLLAGAWVLRGWLSNTVSVSAERIRIAEVMHGDLIRDISAEGKVISANSPTLYAIAPGVVTLHVVAGDVVKRGQGLAEIDSPELRSKLVQEESTLASFEAQASRAELDARLSNSTTRKLLDQAGIDLTAAERDLQRYQRGFDAGAVPEIDVLRAKDAKQKAEIGLAHAREDATLHGEGAQLDARNKRLLAQRQAAVVTEARRQVGLLTLRAPFDGQVGQVQVAQYTNVALNAPVLAVVDLSRFEVEFKVPEGFARELAIGMPAQISSSGGGTWPAAISAISPEVVNGEVTGRLRFKAEQPAGLRQSQRLGVRVVMETLRDTLLVERGPFVDQGGGRYAFVMDRNIAVKRPVRLGASSLNSVQVLDGLAPGDRVVTAGSELFGDAQRVKIN